MARRDAPKAPSTQRELHEIAERRRTDDIAALRAKLESHIAAVREKIRQEPAAKKSPKRTRRAS